MSKDYRFEVYTDYCSGEREFVVRYFDFPNIIGSGETVQEALEEASANLEFYIQYCIDNGKPIVEPSDHFESDYSGKITFRMSKTLHQKIDERAKKENISMNSLLIEAVSDYISSKSTSSSIVKESSKQIIQMAQNLFDKQYECVADEMIKLENETSVNTLDINYI